MCCVPYFILQRPPAEQLGLSDYHVNSLYKDSPKVSGYIWTAPKCFLVEKAAVLPWCWWCGRTRPPTPHWTACHGPSGSLVPHTEHSQVEPSGLCSAAMPNRRVWWKVACHVVRRHMGFYLEPGGSSWLSWVCVARPASVAHRSAPDEHLGSCHHSLWCLLLRMARAQRTLPKSGLKIYNQRSRVPTSQQLDQTD